MSRAIPLLLLQALGGLLQGDLYLLPVPLESTVFSETVKYRVVTVMNYRRSYGMGE
jgi:hypothetical protein